MKTFASKHKYKLLFALILIAVLGTVTFVYLKKKKAKELELVTDKQGANLVTEEQPKEPITIEEIEVESDPTEELLKPAIIEPEDIPA
ncbi:MAG: hypothetical protein JKY03_13925 [Aureispira sp.]|nr:hypothetical protein [Aureispira sp.]